ncbi:hypothetical protein [Blastococcus sp. SYSU D00820]
MPDPRPLGDPGAPLVRRHRRLGAAVTTNPRAPAGHDFPEEIH